jgi:hypothetical protein
MWVKVEDSVARQYNRGLLCADNPNVSFPADLSAETLAEYGVYIGAVDPQPAYDHTKNVSEGPIVLRDGVWTLTWVVADASDAEVGARVYDQWRNVRNDRNSLLASCDFTQLADAPVTTEQRAEWVVYRQALRDVTLQSDPFAIVWPTSPTQRPVSLEVVRV